MRAQLLLVVALLVGPCGGAEEPATGDVGVPQDAPAELDARVAGSIVWTRVDGATVVLRSGAVAPPANLVPGTSSTPVESMFFFSSAPDACYAFMGGDWLPEEVLLGVFPTGPMSPSGDYLRLGLGAYAVQPGTSPVGPGQARLFIQPNIRGEFIYAREGAAFVEAVDADSATLRVDAMLEDGSTVRGTLEVPACVVRPPFSM